MEIIKKSGVLLFFFIFSYFIFNVLILQNRHTVLDHVYCLSMLQARKKHEILGTVSREIHFF